MHITEFAERLRQLPLKGSTPIFARVRHLAHALSDEQYSHLVTQEEMPCAFAWKVQGYPDAVFGLDCFVEHNQEVDAYLQVLGERLRDLLHLQLWQKSYSIAPCQERTYMQISLPHAILKGSEAWVQYMMEAILLDSQEWQDRQASNIIGDVVSDFGRIANVRVQFERIWKDTPVHYFHTSYESAYRTLEILASMTCSTMRCSTSTDGTILVAFDEARG